MILAVKYQNQEWFDLANDYCFDHFKFIENRFLITTRYVQIQIAGSHLNFE